jgi:DNA helicase HerA-like ATPase
MQELFVQNKENSRERLIVLEEAHNFAPEGSYGDVSAGKDNLALTMARKISSEGRKFNLGLVVITQRPAQVSKYVLSQANTQAMFRTMNASDLAAVETYVEFAGRDLIGLLPSLQTGMGILSGLGVPFPVVVRVDSESE